MNALSFFVAFFPRQLRSSTDSAKRTAENLEQRLAKAKADLESSKLAQETTLAEFDSYKVSLASVRLHAVPFFSRPQ